MADMMTLPDTVEEFMEEYKLVDTEQVYTNGIELVPIFRMKQWFEHEKVQLSRQGTTSDLISRQQAIDAADSETVSTNPEHFKSSEKFIKFMDDDDIASFGRWQWANGFNTALVATKVQLEKLPSVQPEPKWIPVSERLPEDMQFVLLTVRRLKAEYNHEPFISVGYIGWNQHHWWCAHDGDCEISNVEVLAWMPLPEAYKPNK